MKTTRKRRNTGRVTLQEVANFAGVGTMTVSRALRTPEQVSDKLREKIEHAVEVLGYIPNGAAGALASGISNIVAVLLPSLSDKASSRFIQSLQQILNKNEMVLLRQTLGVGNQLAGGEVAAVEVVALSRLVHLARGTV